MTMIRMRINPPPTLAGSCAGMKTLRRAALKAELSAALLPEER